MPSARYRIHGLQVYKYGIEGILHWGFNLYHSTFSLRHLILMR
ncbi:glycoside hydrolase domain-containing protein [Lacrimispora sp.]